MPPLESEPRVCYHVLHTQMAANGEYRALMVKENEPGFHLTDWTWGKDFKVAEQIAARKNAALGLSSQDCQDIVDSSIRAQMRQEGAARKVQQGPPSPCGKPRRGQKAKRATRKSRLSR